MERSREIVDEGRPRAAAIRVTAVIDAYNYGRFIEEAIESVLRQDFPAEELEVLVVDDGSTDDTGARVEKYGQRVQYVYKANGGQASAFNWGIERARGEVVALLDADDYWLPGKLRRVMEEFDKDASVGLVYHPLREYVATRGEWRDGEFSAISGNVAKSRKAILQYTAAQTSGLAFRRRFLQELVPLNEAMAFDADAVLVALIIFLAPVTAVAEPLGVYRIHGENNYFDPDDQIDKKRQARRIAMLKIVMEEIDRWLRGRGYDLEQPEILAFRQRWRLLYEKEQFRYETPGRVRFFMHLLRAMTCMNPCLNPKIQTVNAMNAVGSLVFGYRDFTRFDKWRISLKRSLARSS